MIGVKSGVFARVYAIQPRALKEAMDIFGIHMLCHSRWTVKAEA